jgi:hypothetical protein
LLAFRRRQNPKHRKRMTMRFAASWRGFVGGCGEFAEDGIGNGDLFADARVLLSVKSEFFHHVAQETVLRARGGSEGDERSENEERCEE